MKLWVFAFLDTIMNHGSFTRQERKNKRDVQFTEFRKYPRERLNLKYSENECAGLHKMF